MRIALNIYIYQSNFNHDFEIQRSKTKIKDVLQEGLDSKFLSEEEFKAMDPTNMNLARFYANFKLHKQHKKNTAPPLRPIISGSGSITENLGVFVDYHIKEAATKHESYLKDSPDFLSMINKINKGPLLSKNVMLLTMDVTGAYTNIPQEDGTTCLKEALDERPNQMIPSEFLAKLMELILKHNLFEFHEQT